MAIVARIAGRAKISEASVIYAVACQLGSETQVRSRGESAVLVDQAAEQDMWANVSRAYSHRRLIIAHRCREGESAMRPPVVVVLGMRPEHPIYMPLTEDGRRVQALRPDGRDDAFRVGVGFGPRIGVRITLAPSERKTSWKGPTHLVPRSAMRNRMAGERSSRSIVRFFACPVTQAASGRTVEALR